ncbi:MAG: 4Fe-4S dicluster domain-containing protein [bacterium]|nr:4Fe-4S dicluster domain-containing protein [bacterium]
MTKGSRSAPQAVLSRGDFPRLLEALQHNGWTIIGPKVQDGVIVLDEIQSVDDFPIGYSDRQGPARYRLTRRANKAVFGYNVGPQSPKAVLHAARKVIWRGKKNDLKSQETAEPLPHIAFVGIRPCELKAILIQDDVLLRGPYGDAFYAARRKNLFFIVVNCGQAGGTCFCASTNSGPKADSGFDLSATELMGNDDHRFLMQAGSRRGEELLASLPARPVTEEDLKESGALFAHAVETMGRTLDTHGLKELLYQQLENPRWQEVAERCLGCGNCTSVCPTCFCSTVEDWTSLDGSEARRERRWDSCFSVDFSYIHGGSIRQTGMSRYRQWMTHKLAAWQDQFGTLGCVGCGRCITWCPVGIDITEEAAAIRSSAQQKEALDGND